MTDHTRTRTITFADGVTATLIPFGEEDRTMTYEETLADYDRQIDNGGRGRLTADDFRQEKEKFTERWSDPEAFNNRQCHDCGASMGELHQLGCDWEECPRCGGQYYICDCETAEKRRLWSDVDA